MRLKWRGSGDLSFGMGVRGCGLGGGGKGFGVREWEFGSGSRVLRLGSSGSGVWFCVREKNRNGLGSLHKLQLQSICETRK